MFVYEFVRASACEIKRKYVCRRVLFGTLRSWQRKEQMSSEQAAYLVLLRETTDGVAADLRVHNVAVEAHVRAPEQIGLAAVAEQKGADARAAQLGLLDLVLADVAVEPALLGQIGLERAGQPLLVVAQQIVQRVKAALDARLLHAHPLGHVAGHVHRQHVAVAPHEEQAERARLRAREFQLHQRTSISTDVMRGRSIQSAYHVSAGGLAQKQPHCIGPRQISIKPPVRIISPAKHKAEDLRRSCSYFSFSNSLICIK